MGYEESQWDGLAGVVQKQADKCFLDEWDSVQDTIFDFVIHLAAVNVN